MRLKGARFVGAQCAGIWVKDTSLEGCALSGAILDGARLQDVVASRADLRGASLRHANLSRAALQSAQLQGADLFGAFMPFADLSGGALQRANFRRAVLNGSRMRDVRAEAADFRDAVGLSTVNFGINMQGQPLGFPDKSARGTLGSANHSDAVWG